MKKIFKTFLTLFTIGIFFNSCQKIDTLNIFGTASKINYTLSATAIKPGVVDSGKVALTINWEKANYSTDISNIKYLIQIDSSNGNFSRPIFQKSFIGTLSGELLGRELNTAALNLGNNFYSTVNLKIRVVTSLKNNNERIENEPKTFSYTIYPVPAVRILAQNKLWIVGSATPGGWNNPVPDSQFITRSTTDTFVWTGNVVLVKNGEYLMLPKNGNWDEKYGVNDNTLSGLNAGGIFSFGSSNIPGPSYNGVYKLTFNFLYGTFTVQLIRLIGPKIEIPSANKLWIIGDATQGGWDNSNSNKEFVYQQQFNKISDTKYELYTYLNNTGAYKLIQTVGNWESQYHAIAGGTWNTGSFELKNADPGFPAPPTAGIYKITIDFQTGTYLVEASGTKVPIPTDGTLWATGNATDAGWVNDNSTTQFYVNQKFTKIDNYHYTLITNLKNEGGYKLIQTIGNWGNQYHALAGGAWNYGDFEKADADPTFPAAQTAGRYKIYINFINGKYFLEDNNSPVVTPPASNSLFVVGDATEGGWTNPVPTPLQQLTKVSNTLYETYIKFKGTGEYLLLPVNGNWDNKYSVSNKNLDGLKNGGGFGLNLSDNIPGPTTAGIYKLSVNFQTGLFAVSSVTPAVQIPDSIYITGSATPGGWFSGNGALPANQKFTKINATTFKLTINLTGGQEFLVLPEFSWSNKFGKNLGDGTSGSFKYNDNAANFTGPSTTGSYTVTLNFADGTYTIVAN